MPELPEVEITARLVGAATNGTAIESVLAPGINALKTFDPPLHALAGATIEGIHRRGKLFLIDLHAGGPAGPPADYSLLVHLMSAGRLQLFDRRASLRDKASRVLLRLADGERELRLREFGTKQRAWVKLLRREDVEAEETLAALGPEAWPDTPAPEALRALLDQPRPLYAVLRDQHVIAGIGRSWVDEILHTARLSPFKRGADLAPEEALTLRDAIHERLGGALAHYEQKLSLPLPDKLPLPLTVHRHNGEPCPRCGTTIEAVFYEDYVMCYCPVCQTDGKVLKDRRLSRLLK
ncbi:MAG: DNA-formamidopyrimidine glycosylase family protein [Solirubrobacteraceae bacterium]